AQRGRRMPSWTEPTAFRSRRPACRANRSPRPPGTGSDSRTFRAVFSSRLSQGQPAMQKPFDPTTRRLIDLGPADWLQFLHVPVAVPERVTLLDSNLSTVTAGADRVIWVGEPEPWIELIELQSGRDLELPYRLHWYSTLLRRARKVPVHSTIVLLRPVA